MESSKAKKIFEVLTKAYPNARCELDYSSNFELLVATVLSAQCTDKRVNIVTTELFKLANTPMAMVELGQSALEKIIRSCGFYREKSKNILALSNDLVAKYNGEVPSTLEELTALKGVGRKTANVVLSEAFGQNTIAVDTHVFRVSRRLGFSEGKTPLAVEKDLMELFKENASKMHQLLIFHGRYCCKSLKPMCGKCAVRDGCYFEK
ncbi:MAG: endonuclease III [Firmicutes bacterium]|nr:endonuclease III [Bacillota bacterium]